MPANITVTRQRSIKQDNDTDGVADPGDILFHRVIVTNTGNTNATNVVVKDLLTGTTPTGTVNVSPIAFNDSFTAVGNTVLRVGDSSGAVGTINGGESIFVQGNLLANDISVAADGIAAFKIVPATGASAKGGTFNINADGSFNYVNMGKDTDLSNGDQSDADLADGDTFTYTITDAGLDGDYLTLSDNLTSTATVSITFTGRVWYVSETGSAGGNGTSANPFNSFTHLNAAGTDADAAGQTLYVKGNVGGAITLEDNQLLIGLGADLKIGGFTLATAGVANSKITSSTNAGYVVTVGSNATIAGINLEGTGTNTGGITDNQAGTFGTLSLNPGTLNGGNGLYTSTITATGAALSLTDGAVTGNGLSNTSSSGGVNNVSLVNITGTVNLGTGTMTGASGTAFNVNGGNANIGYAGTITDDVGQLVRIVNRTGGTIDFDGLVTDLFDGDGGTGTSEGSVHLGGNTAGTVRFDGGLQLSTGTNDALTSVNAAASAAVLVITDPAGATANRIATGTGQAIEILNTNIGTGGLVFESINVNGAPIGVSLHTTGSTAGLTVTGTGAAGTGGTIQNTGQGATFTSTSALSLTNMNFTNANTTEGTVNNIDNATFNSAATAALNLSSVSTATLTGLVINGNGGAGGQQVGINGSNVANLTLTNSTISGHGDEAAEGGVKLWNLTGVSSVTNTIFSFAAADASAGENHFEVRNGTGTSLTLTMTGNTFNTTRSSTSGSGGVAITTGGNAALTANIVNNDFFGMKTSGVEVFARDTSILNVNVTNGGVIGNANVFDRQAGLSRAIGLNAEDTAQLNFNVIGNTINGSGGPIVNVFGINDAQIQGRINNNQIQGGGVGSVGSPIFIHPEDSANAIIEVLNNQITQVGQDPGIMALTHGDGAGPSADDATLDIRIGGNSVTLTTTAGGNVGIDVRSGTVGGDITKTAAYVFNNSVTLSSGSDVAFLTREGSSTANLYLQNMGAGATNQARATATWNNNGNSPSNSVIAFDLANPAPQPYTAPPAGAPYNGVVRTPTNALLAEALPQEQPAPTPPQDPATTGDDNGGGSGTGSPAPSPADPVVIDDGLLSQSELDLIVEAALKRWADAGATEQQIAAMRAVDISVADLAGLALGESGVGTIRIDRDAAGWRWFIDETPDEDGEYQGSGTRLAAADPLGLAGTRVDLLTVIAHELGHHIGLSDSYGEGDADELMFGTIRAGERRLPGDDEVEAAGGPAVTGAFALADLTLGTLEPGRSVTIEWTSIVNPHVNQSIPLYDDVSTVTYNDGATAMTTSSAASLLVIDTLRLDISFFNDANKNGLFDAGESTISNVVTDLYADTGSVAGQWDNGDTLVGTSVGAGAAFTTLGPGDYIAVVRGSNFNSGQPLFGRMTTIGGADPDDDVNNDDNGIAHASGAVVSRAITLAYNTEPTSDGGGVPKMDVNQTLDFGFMSPNAAPVNTVPGAQNGTEDTARVFNAANANLISIADADAGTGDLTTTVSIADGALAVGAVMAGLVVAGEGTNNLTLTGTIAEINDALNGLSWTPVLNSTAARTLTITTNDNGNLSGNLILNPGAEDGPSAPDFNTTVAPQGWTVVSGQMTAIDYAADATVAGDDLSPADSAAIGGGSSYFAGGPGGDSSISQMIDVGLYATAIDAGRVEANLSGWLGGWQVHDDNAIVTIRYLDAGNVQLGTAQIGPVLAADRNGESSLVLRSTTSVVPAGTRRIEVIVAADQIAGYNDGYADNLSLTLSQKATSTVAINLAAVDDAPVAKPDAVTTAENAALNGNLLADNGSGVDVDVDGPALSIAEVNGQAANVGATITLASGAKLTVNANGTFSYDPNGKFNHLISPAKAAATGATNDGQTESFTYKLTGGNTVTVVVNVTGVDGPGDQLWGNATDNIITGTPDGDFFKVNQAGSETLSGLGGNDGFYFGGMLDATDSVNGGDGQDQIGLQGNYAGLTLDGSKYPDLETFALLSGADNRWGDLANNFYDYGISLTGAWGALTTFNANGLRVGEDMNINASATTAGAFLFFGGFGVETLTGGGADDGFFFGAGRFGVGDTVNGGAGTEDQMALRGDYTVDFNAPGFTGAVTGVETLALISANDPRWAPVAGEDFDYVITLRDNMVLGTDTFTVNGNGLAANETMVVNGADEATATLRLMGGAAADTLTGGGGADKIFGGLGADMLTGNGGADTFIYTNVAQSGVGGIDSILGFASGSDKIDLTAIDADTTTDGNQAFTWSNDGAFHNVAGEVRTVWDAVNNRWVVEADVDGNGAADFTVHVTTPNNDPLTAGDFLF